MAQCLGLWLSLSLSLTPQGHRSAGITGSRAEQQTDTLQRTDAASTQRDISHLSRVRNCMYTVP